MIRAARICSGSLPAALAAALLTVGQTVAGPVPMASAAELPPVEQGNALSADASPTVQIDGVAWTQAVSGTTVYVGGKFATARPAGAARGTNTTPRANVLAYDVRTGALIGGFVADTDAQVTSMAVSPDGRRLYLGGDFTTVNGQPRSRLAAVDVATGAVLPDFAPQVAGRVNAIVASGDRVYVGGQFLSVNGLGRSYLAAVRTDGSLLDWNPGADAQVSAMVMAPDGGRLVVGGSFKVLALTGAYGMGALDPVSGAALPWRATAKVRNAGTDAAITSLTTDGTSIYGSGMHYGQGGNLEGSFAADPVTGDIRWIADCNGDTHWVAPAFGAVFSVGHSHDCTPVSWPEVTPRVERRALSFSTDARGTLGHNVGTPQWDHYGDPAPAMYNWYPDVEKGTATGQMQAGWHVTAAGDYLVMAGEFPSVNGTPQEGLVRFARKAVNRGKQGPMLSGSATEFGVRPDGPGTLRVMWPSNWDRDDARLTYTLQRDGVTIWSGTRDSNFFNRVGMGYVDSGLTDGQSYTYVLRVADPDGHSVAAGATGKPGGGGPSSYGRQVLADGAELYWPLGDREASVQFDRSGFDRGSVFGGVTSGAAGALLNNTNPAVSFDGTATATIGSTTRQWGPDVFTLESWVKTTSTSGGSIMSFGSARNAPSPSFDRLVAMSSSGTIHFGLNVPNVGRRVIASAEKYNDGAWHHVVASNGASGMQLYVDGRRVARDATVSKGGRFLGYWRVGGDNLAGWPVPHTSDNLAGSIDEFAVYPTELSYAQVQQHVTASGRSTATPAPADGYGRAVTGDRPAFFWRLDEPAGAATAVDTSAKRSDGVYAGTPALRQPGFRTGTGTAAQFDSSDDAVVSTDTFAPGTAAAVELWFNTRSTTGGTLATYGDPGTRTSPAASRLLWMRDDGRLSFAAGTGTGRVTVTSDAAYRDGAWHHVVAQQDGSTLTLYVDGAAVRSTGGAPAVTTRGTYTVGLGPVADGSTGAAFAGRVDEVAVYDHALTADQVTAHVTAAGPAATNTPPTASFTATADAGSVSVDGSASSDTDGQVVGWDWDFGDGVRGNGRTATHRYAASGTYTVKLTITDDRGATATTTRQVAVSTQPNQPPVAAFTSTAAGLTVSFDGSGSTDPDGKLTSYAWNFGDGTTGTGAQATHTYTQGGTMSVTLTVTDDLGATTSVVRKVDVTAPAAPLLQDTFTRTATGTWGAATPGPGAWTQTGSSAAFSVADGEGRMDTPKSTMLWEWANGVSATSLDTTMRLRTTDAITGSGLYVTVAGRGSRTDGYRAKVRMRPGDAVNLQLVRLVGGAESGLTSEILVPATVAAGTDLRVRVQVTGTGTTTIRAKVWSASKPEPADWQQTATDTTASLQSAGAVGLSSYLGGSSTIPSVVLRVDDVTVLPVP